MRVVQRSTTARTWGSRVASQWRRTHSLLPRPLPDMISRQLFVVRSVQPATRRRTSSRPSWTSLTRCSTGVAWCRMHLARPQRASWMWAAALEGPRVTWHPAFQSPRSPVSACLYLVCVCAHVHMYLSI